MNILFVSSQFPNPAEPNRGVFSLQIVRELRALADVRVVAPVPTLGPFTPLDALKHWRTAYRVPERHTIDGAAVYHPAYFAMPGMGFTHAMSLYRPLKALLAEIRASWRIDAINCHWLFPDGVAVRAASEDARIPLLLTALGDDLNRLGEFPWRRQRVTRALVTADAVSVLSTPMYEQCLRLGVDRARLHLIPNGVDLDTFALLDRTTCRASLNMPSDAQVILFVGSLVPVKNVALLLRAFSTLRGSRAQGPLKLYVVGSGFLERDLRQLAAELRIDGDVLFAGAVAHHELPTWMNAADCLCLPSLSEGHPNVVMEALACGLPVVASAVGSVPDYVDGRNGRVFATTDQAGLSDALAACLSTRYDRERIRSTVADKSWRRCAAEYFAVLSAFVGKN